jgi:hypothetical protein
MRTTDNRIQKLASDCMAAADECEDIATAAELLEIAFRLLQLARPELRKGIPGLDELLEQMR